VPHSYRIRCNTINLSSGKASNQLDSNPVLFGNKVVWERYDGSDYEIMYYDGNTTRQVTSNTRNDRFPQVSNEIIAWTGYDGSDNEIYQTYIGFAPSNPGGGTGTGTGGSTGSTGSGTNASSHLNTTLIRFRNVDKPGTYLFTGEQEAASVRQNYRNFFQEGVAFQVASAQTDPLLQPFYRFRNTSPGREGTYLFAGSGEAASIRQNYRNFVEEGVAFYAYPAGTGNGTTNFNRFQNNGMPGTYLFAGPGESSSIINNPNFTCEGPAFAAG
jgi:hypothetical protein